MPQSLTPACLPCRLRLFLRLSRQLTRKERLQNTRPVTRSQYKSSHSRCGGNLKIARSFSTATNHRNSNNELSQDADAGRSPPEGLVLTREAVHQTEDEEQLVTEAARDIELDRTPIDPETMARQAQKKFGDRLPEDLLNEDELKIYTRLFGEPLKWTSEEQQEQEVPGDRVADKTDILLKEGADGALEEVEYEKEETLDEVASNRGQGIGGRQDKIHDPSAQDDAMATLQQDIDQAPALNEENEQDRDEADPQRVGLDEPLLASGEEIRAHPFTLASRSGTDPSTIQIPRASMAGPVSVMLSDFSNKHLDETAHRVFGGQGLPYSTSSPVSSRSKPQKPIALSAYQSMMAPMEGDVYMAALMPGFYASITSVLVEVRRRLGSQWISKLLSKEGGPSVLDAGAGGAGVVAWREILKAEWGRMREVDPSSSVSYQSQKSQHPPLGKSTVLTGCAALRQRASLLLENTTFLPRLPDYVHVSHDPSNPNVQRKQFDVILAPHSLWRMEEEYQRKQHLQNLWAMLNPDGGVLVILEKGVPRGFEVVASARQHILDRLFLPSSPDLAPEPEEEELPASESTHSAPSDLATKTRRRVPRAPGSIIAPCTTHAKCPLYRSPGTAKNRKDYCHFSQRYIRPPYWQRMVGARSRNWEDVKFAYVAVQKGVTREDLMQRGTVRSQDAVGKQVSMGKEAADRAFEGYDVHDADLVIEGDAANSMSPNVTATASATNTASTPTQTDGKQDPEALTTPPPPHHAPNGLILPRLIQTPLKRHGHVMLDVCTPQGSYERWTVPKSYGKQAYRDARKAHWGDLWALGAKLRVPKDVRVGRVLPVAEDAEGGEIVEGEGVVQVDDGVERKGLTRKARSTQKKLKRERDKREDKRRVRLGTVEGRDDVEEED